MSVVILSVRFQGAIYTCDAPASCAKCGFTAGVALGHKDTNQDHICDRNCGKADMGVHEDKNKDHACDYGCGRNLTEHSGGTATCTECAICAICGELASHHYDRLIVRIQSEVPYEIPACG